MALPALTDDDYRGMLWWNELNEFMRAYWLSLAPHPSAKDAWETYKKHHEEEYAPRH